MTKTIKIILISLMMLVFIITIPSLGNDWSHYLIPFLISIITLSITLALLNNNIKASLPVLIVLSVFLFAYFMRFYFVVTNPALVHFLVPTAVWASFDDRSIQAVSFYYFNIAFVVFCLSVIFFGCVSLQRCKNKTADTCMDQPEVPPSHRIIVAALVSYTIIDLLFVSRGIGKMGTFVENPLPFKLTGALIYTKGIILPFLLMLQIYRAKKDNCNKVALFGVLVIAASGIFDMFVFDSRGAFLLQIATLGLVWVLAGFKINKTATIIIVMALIGYLFAVPIIVAQRLNIPLESLSMNQVLEGLTFVFFRLTGIDQFMVIYNQSEPIPLGDIWGAVSSPRGIAGFYTTELLGYADDVPQTFAPSFLGYLYLAGGLPGIVLGSLILGGFVTIVWDRLDGFFPKTAPVLKGYLIIQMLSSITDGFSKTAFTSCLVVLICSWLSEKTFSIKDRGSQHSYDCS